MQELAVYQGQLPLDDLVGSSSAFCACVPYIHMVHLHKCLEISPTGTNSLTMPYLHFISAWKLAPQGPIPLQCFFLTKHYKLKTNIHINFEIWKQKQEKGWNLNFNKRLHWKILNKDNLELPI